MLQSESESESSSDKEDSSFESDDSSDDWVYHCHIKVVFGYKKTLKNIFQIWYFRNIKAQLDSLENHWILIEIMIFSSLEGLFNKS